MAPGYITHLLHFNERDIQLVVSNSAYFLIHPTVQSVHPITYLNNQPAWLLDYIVRNVGTVVPQRLWSPLSSTDAQRYATVPLHMPIFFVLNGTVGLPLNQAAAGDCAALLNARQPAPVGDRNTTNIRIMVSILSEVAHLMKQLCLYWYPLLVAWPARLEYPNHDLRPDPST